MPRYPTTPRQPAADGPDVVRVGNEYDMFLDGRYLGSRAHAADAWSDANRAWADARAASRYECADAYAAHCEATALAEVR